MANHLYDENGNYRGKILSDKEHKDRQSSAAGCLMIVAIFLIIALPVYIFYFLIFDMRNKLKSAGMDETFWMSIFASVFILSEGFGSGGTAEEKKLIGYAWLIMILTLVTTYFLLSLA